MSAAANITVKKYDNTTDIIWSLVSASGGDKSPAVWRSNSATGTAGQKPTFTVTSRWNAAGDVRRIDIAGGFPSVYTDTSTSLTSVRSKASFTASFAIPQDMSTADMNEAAAQIFHLLSDSSIIGTVATGYAPT